MTDQFSGKRKVRFLTCLWGWEHSAHWLTLALPALLAPGNLPALAADAELEFVVLTERHLFPHIRKHVAFRRLQTVCPVRFIAIDDLIVGTTYGVTLTLAYARGIMDAGAEQTNTWFVFMNSDFILADGSLATLAANIAKGHRCIVAPSLRASAEPVLPALRKLAKKHEINVKPRALVSLALANLHPSTIGKFVDQNAIHCVSFNQTYWRVDQSTLLGRYHLLFMLCIRPERPLGPVNSYCDYGLIPELVPSSPMVALNDSDEFFMLELGPESQEDNLMQVGPANLGQMAKALRQWTTKEHRQSATMDMVFHSGPLPDKLAAASEIATAFISRLHARMGSAVSHVHHRYWIGGLQHWLRAKDPGSNARIPNELAGGRLEKWLTRYDRMVAWMQGPASDVPIHAYDWNDFQLVRRWFLAIGERPDRSVLLVCPEKSILRDALTADSRVDVLTYANQRVTIPRNAKRYRHILLHAPTEALPHPEYVFEPLLDSLEGNGEIAIFFNGQRRIPATADLNTLLRRFLRLSMRRQRNELIWDIALVNGSLLRRLGSVLFKATDVTCRDFINARPRWAPVGILAALALLPAIAVLNACSFDRLALRMSSFRSAALLRCRRVGEKVEEDRECEDRPAK